MIHSIPANQLQTYYYVVIFRGISNAAAHLGFRQPGVSGAIQRLESALNLGPLFERKPFCLTPAGAMVFERIRDCFASMDHFVAVGALAPNQILRIGCSELVHEGYLGDLIELLRDRAPGVQIRMENKSETEFHNLLLHGLLDLLVVAESPLLRQFERTNLLSVPLVLLVPTDHPLRDPKELWAKSAITEPLIRCDAAEAVVRTFNRGLHDLGVKWRPTIFPESLASVTAFVAQGHGIGLSVDMPACTQVEGVRALPLVGFDSLEICAYHRKDCGDLVPHLTNALIERASAEIEQLRKSVLTQPVRKAAAHRRKTARKVTAK